MNNLDWKEFCKLYFETAKQQAVGHLRRMKEKNGTPDRHVDEDYVIDAAVLAALEKTYTHFDDSRGGKITTYLSTLVHNELADELKKESKAAQAKQDLNDVKAAIRAIADEEPGSFDGYEARESLFPMLRAAVAKLSPSDQVILNYYLEDQSTYIAKSAEALNMSDGYVSVRRHRIMKLLPKLMGMTRSDFIRHCDRYESLALEDSVELRSISAVDSPIIVTKKERSVKPSLRSFRIFARNPIVSSISAEDLAAKLFDNLF